jgi:hypothetical protein
MSEDLPGEIAPAETESPRRSYRRPELRELGSLQQLTQSGSSNTSGTYDGTGYSS